MDTQSLSSLNGAIDTGKLLEQVKMRKPTVAAEVERLSKELNDLTRLEFALTNETELKIGTATVNATIFRKGSSKGNPRGVLEPAIMAAFGNKAGTMMKTGMIHQHLAASGALAGMAFKNDRAFKATLFNKLETMRKDGMLKKISPKVPSEGANWILTPKGVERHESVN